VVDTEWWDVIDAAGDPTGETYRRGANDWPAGRFHLIVATAVVRTDGSVLLTRRAATKEFALAWEFPGGSALAGESSRRAARRELHEETGLLVPTDSLRPVGRFREASALLDMYLAPVHGVTDVTPDEVEVDRAEWVSWNEVEARLRAGRMAEPWTDRLEALLPPLRRIAGP